MKKKLLLIITILFAVFFSAKFLLLTFSGGCVPSSCGYGVCTADCNSTKQLEMAIFNGILAPISWVGVAIQVNDRKKGSNNFQKLAKFPAMILFIFVVGNLLVHLTSFYSSIGFNRCDCKTKFSYVLYPPSAVCNKECTLEQALYNEFPVKQIIDAYYFMQGYSNN